MVNAPHAPSLVAQLSPTQAQKIKTDSLKALESCAEQAGTGGVFLLQDEACSGSEDKPCACAVTGAQPETTPSREGGRWGDRQPACPLMSSAQAPGSPYLPAHSRIKGQAERAVPQVEVTAEIPV